jgi:hypothetical protein
VRYKIYDLCKLDVPLLRGARGVFLISTFKIQNSKFKIQNCEQGTRNKKNIPIYRSVICGKINLVN